jgi:hypothetical protein
MSTGKTTTKAKRKTTTQEEKAEAQQLMTISWNDLKKEDQDKLLSGLPCRDLTTKSGKQVVIPPAIPLAAMMPCKVLAMTPTAHYWMGILTGMDIFNYTLCLSSWIPNIGRHHIVLQGGEPDGNTEIEPHHQDVRIHLPRAGTVMMEWNFPLWDEPS